MITKEQITIEGPYLPEHIDAVVWVVISDKVSSHVYITGKEIKEMTTTAKFYELYNRRLETALIAMNDWLNTNAERDGQ